MSVQIGNIDLGEFPLLLAPMEDVSDPPFRYVCKQNGADMMYTEFISSEGLIRDAAKSRQKLDIFEYERPIGIQIFGSDIDHMRECQDAWVDNPQYMENVCDFDTCWWTVLEAIITCPHGKRLEFVYESLDTVDDLFTEMDQM